MKRLMTVAFAAVLAGGAYATTAPCGDPCLTYDFKAAITKPIGKPAPSECGDCGYRTKASGKLTGWLVLCDCSTPALVVVIDKEKTAYVTTGSQRIGWEVLNIMGKPGGLDVPGKEAEGLLWFTLCDPSWCNEQSWDIWAAGFGTVKVISQAVPCADPTTDVLVTGLSGTLNGWKPGASVIIASECTDTCTCVIPCVETMRELDPNYTDGPTSMALDVVSGTWSIKYNAKVSLDPIAAIKTALGKMGVTKVIENCSDLGTVTEWAGLTSLLQGSAE